MTETGATSRVRYRTLAAVAGGAGVGVLTGVVLTGATPVRGIANAGEVVSVALPVTRAVLDLAVVVAIGFALLPVLVGDRRPKLAAPVLARARPFGVVAALVWAVAALALLVLQTAEYNPAGGRVGLGDVGRYVADVTAGKGLLVAAGLALTLAGTGVAAMRGRGHLPAEVHVGLGLFALLPLPLTGHGSADSHGYLLFSIVLHVFGAVLWTGGLVALTVLLTGNRTLLTYALPRFSRLATGCLLLTAATGLFNALLELGSSRTAGLWETLFGAAYGQLVLVKVACLVVIALSGGYLRWRVLPSILRHRRGALAAWATAEVAIMGIAFGVAAVLSRAPVT